MHAWRAGEGFRGGVDPDALSAARRASPEAFLRQRYGDAVESGRRGRSLSVDGILRADLTREGVWIACDWQGGGIGDNVALMRRESGCGFAEAVERLSGMAALAPLPAAPPRAADEPSRPRVPRESDAGAGRAYLAGRGVSADSVAAAERCGALSYCSGALLFLGRDLSSPARDIRLAALRYLEPMPGRHGRPQTKRDLWGSSKDFPVVVEGDPGFVAIVEGGVNALAVRDLRLRRGGAAPTVIATGGVGVRHWLEGNPAVRAMVAEARTVVVVGENEADPEGCRYGAKQANTDILRARLAADIRDIRNGRSPRVLFPPPGADDAASWNLPEFRGLSGRAWSAPALLPAPARTAPTPGR